MAAEVQRPLMFEERWAFRGFGSDSGLQGFRKFRVIGLRTVRVLSSRWGLGEKAGPVARAIRTSSCRMVQQLS